MEMRSVALSSFLRSRCLFLDSDFSAGLLLYKNIQMIILKPLPTQFLTLILTKM